MKEVRVSAGQVNRTPPALRRVITKFKSKCDLFLGPLYIENGNHVLLSFFVLRNSENYFLLRNLTSSIHFNLYSTLED